MKSPEARAYLEVRVHEMKHLSVILSILLCTCGTANKPTDEHSSELTSERPTENDRLIFYHLDEQEYDSLAALPDSEGLAEVDSDFSYHASNVLDSMRNTELKVDVTSERFINVGERTIDKFEHFGYGVILVRSDSINIQAGVMTDIDYFMLITEFYGL